MYTKIVDKTNMLCYNHAINTTELPKVIDYKKGKTNVVGFLVGQVMKESKGKANPQIINNLIRTKLESK